MRIIFLVLISFLLLFAKERSNQEIYDIVKYFLKEHNITREIIMPNEHNNTIINFAVPKASIHLKSDVNKSIDVPIIIPQIKKEDKNSLDNNKTKNKKHYKIIKLRPTGWIIVSTEDIANPILGYSFDSDASDELPIEFKAWLNAINKDIEISKGLTYKDNIPLKDRSYKSYTYKAPLLGNINLGQKTPYNMYTPVIGGEHVPVGCVATAFVQIMKYYRWPKRSKGNHSYIWNNQRLYANFNTSYNYNSLESLAKLSYNLGVAFDMGYGLNGSGTVPTKDRLNRVSKSFGYIIPPLKKKSNYTRDEWDRFIKDSIDRGHPIYYQGLSSPTYGGHAFILDGYSYENNVKMYHFNWGWSGYYNGWFTLEPIRGYSLIRFPYSQRAIFNIRPKRSFNPSSTPSSNTSKKIATIIYPKNSMTIKHHKLTIKVDRQGLKRVQLLIYGYKKKGYLYNRYIKQDNIAIDIPRDETYLRITLISYKNNKVIGKKSIKVFVNDNKDFKKVKIKEFNKYINEQYKISWENSNNYKIKLIIYSYTLKKYIYQKYVTGNSKIVQIPANSGDIIVAIYAYDKNYNYIGRTFIFTTIKSKDNKEYKKLILSPKDNQVIYDKNITLNLNNNQKIRVGIYSYSLKRYIFDKFINKSKFSYIPPLNKDRFFIVAQIVKNGQVLKEDMVHIEFNKIATIERLNSSKYKDGHSIKVKVNTNGNSNVKLGVYSYTNKKYLFFKKVNNKKKYYLFIPKEDKCLVVQLVTYDKNNNYLNQDYRYLSY